MRAILASAVILVSAGAWAQSVQNSAAGPDNGFFRPTPGNDPSLTHPRTPVPENAQPFLGAQPPMVQLPRQAQVPVTVPVATAQPVPNTEQRVVEEADAQTTQAENDAQVAAARAAATSPTR